MPFSFRLALFPDWDVTATTQLAQLASFIQPVKWYRLAKGFLDFLEPALAQAFFHDDILESCLHYIMLSISHRASTSVVAGILNRALYITSPGVLRVVKGKKTPKDSKAESTPPKVTAKLNQDKLTPSKIKFVDHGLTILLPVIKHVPELYIRYATFDKLMSSSFTANALQRVDPANEILIKSFCAGLSGMVGAATAYPIEAKCRALVYEEKDPRRCNGSSRHKVLKAFPFFFADKYVGSQVALTLAKHEISQKSKWQHDVVNKLITNNLIARI